jgi:hypothetical protein
VELVCESQLGKVHPAPRLHQATSLMGEQGVFLNGCVADFRELLIEAFDRVVLLQGATLCPSLTMAQEPLEVVGFTAQDDRDLIFGPDYTFVGPTESCPEGALRLQGDVGELEEVRLRYCAL